MTVADKILRAKEDYDAVYESGKSRGNQEGYDRGHQDGTTEGMAVGKQEAYDAFWDTLQDNGNRTNYSYAFNHWTNENFKPKYDINATDLQYAFRYSTITDLVEILKKQGVKLDVSNATNLASVFFYADSVTTCPTIDVSKSLIKDFAVFTHAHAMKTIEKIILPTGKVMTFTNPFHTCTNLENIVFEGDIMANGLNFQWSPKLSKDSIVSIVNALSPDTSGLTVTLSKTAVNNAFPSEEVVDLTPFDGVTYATGGIDFIDNGDGSVTVDGMSESYGSFRFKWLSLEKGAEYTFSVEYSSNYSGTACPIFCYDKDGNMIGGAPVSPNSPYTFTADSDGCYAEFTFETNAYEEYDNLTVRPKLTKKVTWDALVATKPNWTITLS